MNFKVEKNTLTSSDFIVLREEKYFEQYEKKDIDTAIKNSLFTVVIKDKEKTIGMGRIVGDDRVAFFIKDVVVGINYRGIGIGGIIIKELLEYIELKGCDKAYIGLSSTPNKEYFYEKFGFRKRPNSMEGHGMIKYLIKENKDDNAKKESDYRY